MRIVITAVLLLVMFPEGLFGEEIQIAYRQTASRRMLSLLWEEFSWGEADISITEYPGEAQEVGFRFRSFRNPELVLGRFVYAGPLRMLITPSGVIMPDALSGGRRWSLYQGALLQGKTAAGLTLEGEQRQFEGILDLERSLAAAAAAWDGSILSAGTAAAFRWEDPRRGASWWRYRRIPAAGQQMMHLVWGTLQLTSVQFSLTGAWSGGSLQPYGWLIQAAGMWEDHLLSAQAGIMYLGSSQPFLNIVGEEISRRFSIEGDVGFELPGPLELHAAGLWALDPVPPWPAGRYLPGEAYGEAGLAGRWKRGECSVGLRKSVSWKEGALEHEHELIIAGSAEIGVLQAELESSGGEIKGALTGSWNDTELTLEAVLKSGGSTASASAVQKLPWGEVSLEADSCGGFSIAAEVSGVIYSR